MPRAISWQGHIRVIYFQFYKCAHPSTGLIKMLWIEVDSMTMKQNRESIEGYSKRVYNLCITPKEWRWSFTVYKAKGRLLHSQQHTMPFFCGLLMFTCFGHCNPPNKSVLFMLQQYSLTHISNIINIINKCAIWWNVVLSKTNEMISFISCTLHVYRCSDVTVQTDYHF